MIMDTVRLIGKYQEMIGRYTVLGTVDSKSANQAFDVAKKIEKELLTLPETEWVNALYPLTLSSDNAVRVFSSLCIHENSSDPKLKSATLLMLRDCAKQPGLTAITVKYWLMSKKLL